MTEWKLLKSKMDVFLCPSCGKESKVRGNTRKKLCKGCGSVFERIK